MFIGELGLFCKPTWKLLLWVPRHRKAISELELPLAQGPVTAGPSA
jgi:hypothetical protein